MTSSRDHIGAAYYQTLHDTNPAFLANNWLLPEMEQLQRVTRRTDTVLELGCGNGRFLEAAANHWATVTGVDWAKSPHLEKVLHERHNVAFIQADVSTLELSQRYDLIVSADFLEHLPGALLPGVIDKTLGSGRFHFHKIACYDDGHSHLSILPPEQWLALFHAHPLGGNMRIARSEFRKGKKENVVVILSNLPS
ncbi:class I SAM-dependent methyltransferase [Polaromonas sp. YR568]|uniref:class I SAM-dependent methyltransferase n=1 Tax=Polaromonas sp. YR568 TaxID=1855301 RepID=UPI0031379A86